MIQIRSRLDVADNTGARMATMIGVIGKQTAFASIGDVITCNVKESSANGTVKKGEVVRAVVVRTKQPVLLRLASARWWSEQSNRSSAATVPTCVLITTRLSLSTRI